MCLSNRGWRSAAFSLVIAGFFALIAFAPYALAQNATAGAAQKMLKPLTYPTTRKGDQVDNYHGVTVADPYRWLEDLDSEETRNWVESQNKLTNGFLNDIPVRAKIRERLTRLWNYERFGVPFREGKNYFYSRNSGLQNQSVLYTRYLPRWSTDCAS